MIENKDRLILALDFPDFATAKKIVDDLGDEVNFYKIGFEMLMSGDYFKMIEFLKSKNKKVFADLKLYDIPETVARAVHNLAQYHVDFLTIHAANHDMMLQTVKNKGKTRILAVTVLTSLEKDDLNKMGFDPKLSVAELVVKKAKDALECGVDGVVASSLEAKKLRLKLGDNFLIVTPGIRLELASDDQKRVADVKTALSNKVSHLVVGRPITQSGNPLEAAKKFNELISRNIAA